MNTLAGLCNDAVSLGEQPFARALPELPGRLAEHGRWTVRDEQLSPAQPHLDQRAERAGRVGGTLLFANGQNERQEWDTSLEKRGRHTDVIACHQ